MGSIISYLLEMDLPLLFAVFGKYFFSTFFVYFFMYKLLPNRLNIYTLILLSLIPSLWSCLNWGSYFFGASDIFGSTIHFWMNMFINTWTYFVLIFLYRGKLWKKIIVWWYFDVIKTLCEVVAYVPVLLYNISRGINVDWAWTVSSVESNVLLKLLHLSVMFPLFILLGYLSLTIWRRILMRSFQPFYLFLMVLPMGVKYSFSNVFHPGLGDWFLAILINFTDLKTSYYILSLLGILICLVASIAILYYILSYDKRTAVEADLLESKREMELKQARYFELERRSEELAKIRHDFNNQLASIIELVKVGEDGTAQRIISTLSREINQELDT